MANRLDLQAALEEILGSRNVYFNPPEDLRMSYDAIRYALGGKNFRRADNKVYKSTNQYDGVVITRNPDTDIPDKLIANFEMISVGKPYKADNLNHYPFTIYY